MLTGILADHTSVADALAFLAVPVAVAFVLSLLLPRNREDARR